MVSLKQLLIESGIVEAVPVKLLPTIQSGLKSKYGNEMEEYTFGVEFEFEPVTETQYLNRDEIISALSDVYGTRNGQSLRNDFSNWLENERKDRKSTRLNSSH